MIAELGQLALLFALAAALHQAVFPMIGAGMGAGAADPRLTASARSAALAQFGFLALAFGLLGWLHATSDFSVRNVFENSHTAKPFIYKLTGVWGNHEGSMLLWALILAGYGAALALARSGITTLRARTLSVQGMLAAAFIAFIAFTSNPFDRLSPAPLEGQDLNPLLQDPGLAIHPPFLYLGYVGFSIAFAFAAAGLIGGRIDEAWAKEVRPWALAAWGFMTVGIALGAWWAYYELGWGGFWAWDPVENASFMPWLAGTALIHSIRVTEVRGAFRGWTALLALLAFSLSLVGTFLVRSGILTSVHAFAVDPARGVFILAILAASVGGGLALFAVRAPALSSDAKFSAVSREGGLFANNLMLVAACATVFIGTFYPLFAEAVAGEKLSVGAPYFNLAFTPFVFLSLLMIGPAAALSWKKGRLSRDARLFLPAGAAALAAAGIAFWLAAPKSATAATGVALAVFAAGSVFADLWRRVRPRETGAFARFAGLPRSSAAMAIAHAGLAIVVIGVVGAGVWKSETIAYAQPGETVSVGRFDVVLRSVAEAQGPNYVSQGATFDVVRDGKVLQALVSERRFYPARGMATTEAAVWTTLRGDLYLTIGEPDPERGWVVRAWDRPLAAWMWAGGALMALGAFVGIAPVRRRGSLVARTGEAPRRPTGAAKGAPAE
ncbi:MAG: heme lyase CcmF/NrfE family subunit [Alphaproteobacteria bacterium]|nr:heme lyase CcmF/NrfE family subunit [Alphaproteobacteria bacterium]